MISWLTIIQVVMAEMELITDATFQQFIEHINKVALKLDLVKLEANDRSLTCFKVNYYKLIFIRYGLGSIIC